MKKCNHRNTILGRKWVPLLEGRFSLAPGGYFLFFCFEELFETIFTVFFRVIQPSNRIKKNETKSLAFLLFWPSQLNLIEHGGGWGGGGGPFYTEPLRLRENKGQIAVPHKEM